MLKLEPPEFSVEELEQTVTWLNDPVLMKYSEQRLKEHTVKTQLDYIHSMAEPHQYRKITCNAAYIGTISALVDTHNRVADVGILIGSTFIGKGHGCEAWRQFCQELFKLGIRKIEGGCMAKNTAMIRVFEKNHMRLEGTRRYHFMTKQGADHMLLYGLLT